MIGNRSVNGAWKWPRSEIIIAASSNETTFPERPSKSNQLSHLPRLPIVFMVSFYLFLHSTSKTSLHHMDNFLKKKPFLRRLVHRSRAARCTHTGERARRSIRQRKTIARNRFPHPARRIKKIIRTERNSLDKCSHTHTHTRRACESKEWEKVSFSFAFAFLMNSLLRFENVSRLASAAIVELGLMAGFRKSCWYFLCSCFAQIRQRRRWKRETKKFLGGWKKIEMIARALRVVWWADWCRDGLGALARCIFREMLTFIAFAAKLFLVVIKAGVESLWRRCNAIHFLARHRTALGESTRCSFDNCAGALNLFKLQLRWTLACAYGTMTVVLNSHFPRL